MRLLLGKRGPGQRAERERREAGHRSGRGHYQIIKVGRIRQMSGIGPWRWNQINDNPCIVALYHKLLRLLCQECLYPRCRCWSLIMWPDTCHMTPGGNWSRGKIRGSQSVKITLDLGGKKHHKTNTCCNQQPVVVVGNFPWTFMELPQALSSHWEKSCEIEITESATKSCPFRDIRLLKCPVQLVNCQVAWVYWVYIQYSIKYCLNWLLGLNLEMFPNYPLVADSEL